MTHSQKPWWDSFANSWPEDKHGTQVGSGAPFQLLLIPCFPPLNGRGRLLNYYFSNPNNVAAQVVLWDQNLTDSTGFTTSGTVGSSSVPSWVVNIPPLADVGAVCLQEKAFQTGIAGQTTQANIFWCIQVAITALG